MQHISMKPIIIVSTLSLVGRIKLLSSKVSNSLSLLILLIICMSGVRTANAQALDILLNTNLGSGLQMIRTEDKTTIRNSPLILVLETDFVFDHDYATQMGAKLILPLDGDPKAGISPVLKLVQDYQPFTIYLLFSAPFFFSPKTILGIETGGGLLYPISDLFSVVGEINLTTFVAGKGLADDSIIFQFNVFTGLHLNF